jgi:hypothetical protein
MIETSAQNILKCHNPGSDFADMMKQATEGCLFIDEAYRFSPAPAGQKTNASNEVLEGVAVMDVASNEVRVFQVQRRAATCESSRFSAVLPRQMR